MNPSCAQPDASKNIGHKSMTVTLDKGPHIYRVDNIVRPGYSEILDSVGFPKNPFWTEEGKILGTSIHEWLLFLAKGEVADSAPDPRIAGRILGIEKFLREHRFEFVGGEAPLYCQSLGYCVTPDLWGNLDGEPTVIEAKRGAKMIRHKLQTAAQALALDEIGFHAEKRLGLYLQDGSYIPEYHDDEEDFECWKAIVAGYYAKEQYK